MNRRHLLGVLAGMGLWPLGAGAAPNRRRAQALVVQDSPLAGFQHHAGERLWADLAEGQPLDLVREPDNRHDRRAVAIHWRGQRLGYLPAFESTAVAQMLDRGVPLQAEILALEASANPWRRVRVRVWLSRGRLG